MSLPVNHKNNQSQQRIVNDTSVSSRLLLVQNVFPDPSSVIHLLQDPSSGMLEKVKLAAIFTFGKFLKLNIPNFYGVYGYFYICTFDV